MNIGSFDGMRVMSSPLAREVRDEYRVERSPIRKRRRNWSVVKHHIDKPCAYVLGGHTIVAHPEIVAKLKGSAA